MASRIRTFRVSCCFSGVPASRYAAPHCSRHVACEVDLVDCCWSELLEVPMRQACCMPHRDRLRIFNQCNRSAGRLCETAHKDMVFQQGPLHMRQWQQCMLNRAESHLGCPCGLCCPATPHHTLGWPVPPLRRIRFRTARQQPHLMEHPPPALDVPLHPLGVCKICGIGASVVARLPLWHMVCDWIICSLQAHFWTIDEQRTWMADERTKSKDPEEAIMRPPSQHMVIC